MATLEQLLIEIDASTESLRRELKRADDSISGFSRSTGRAMDSIEKELARTGRAFSSLQQNIDRANKIGEEYSRSTQRQAQNIAAYGAEMDRLRAKFNPLFAAQQQYKGQLTELQNALRVGAINQAEYGAALTRTKAQFADQVRVINGVQQPFAAASRSYGSLGAVAQQAGFQVGDFAVQVASGQSAVVAFTQQASQLLGFFGPIGAVAGAAAAIFGGLYLAFRDNDTAASDAAKSLDEYKRSIENARRASKDLDAQIVETNESLESQTVLAIESQVASEDAIIKGLNARIRAQIEQRNFFQQAIEGGLTGQARDAAEKNIERLNGRISSLSAELDQSTARMEGYVARLAILRDTLSPGGGSGGSSSGGVVGAVTATSTATVDLSARLEETTGRLEALQSGGLMGAAAFDRLAKAEGLAERQAESYNRANADAIKSGQLKAKTAEDYLPTAMSLVDAEEAIRDITEKLTQAEKDHADAIREKNKAIDAQFDAYGEMLDRSDDLRDSLERQIADTDAMTAAYQMGSREAAILAKTQAILAKNTNLSAEEIRDFAEKMVDAERRLSQMRASSEFLADSFDRAFDRIGSAITEAFAKGEISAINFGDIARAVVSELIQDFLKLAAINPLKNALFGGSNPTIGSVLSTGSSIFGGANSLTSAGSFFGNMFGGGSLGTSLVYSPTGANLGLSSMQTIAGTGGMQGLAPTGLGSGILQAGSLAVAPFLGMGAAALASLFMKKDLPRSAAQLGAQNGLFGVTGVDVGNGGDPAVGQAIGDAAAGIANAFLEVSGLRLGSGASLGMIGLDQRVFRSTTSVGAYSQGPDVLGIAGLPNDARSFDKTVGGQRAASADFAVRNLLKQVLEGTLDGLTDTTAETLKLGLGNLARNIESSMTEGGAEDFARRLEILAGWDNLREQMVGLDTIAGDTARRLERAAKSQEAFNSQISALREEANKAVAESGSGLKGIGSFIDDANALFDPTGGNRFQLRYQLAMGGGSNSIDGNANVYTDPGENGRGRTLRDIFSFGQNDRSSGVNPNQIMVFDQLIETIDLNLGENGKLIEAFHKAGDNLDFNISRLTDILEERGVELQPILDDFFNTDVARERLNEAADMARFKVDQFFESLVGAGDAISGPRQLFEDIVPAVSPIVEQFENLKAQIEATRPDIEALNEDLAAMGEAVIDVDSKIGQATGMAAEQAQNQFLAGLGIAVGADGTIRQASVDFDAINSLANTIKGLDENARVLFENDPRGLTGEVTAKINEILQSGITQILSGAEDSATTLEQLQIVFGDRINGFNTTVSNATDPLAQFTDQVTAAASALDSQISELQRSTDAAKALARGFYSTADSLLVDRSLSVLSPGARLEEARRQILDLESQFRAGDTSVASEIQSLSRPFLEAAQDVYGASANYAAESSFIQNLLRGLGDSVMSEMDVALDQLEVLKEIRDSLGINANGNARNFGTNAARNQALAALFPEFTGDFRDGNFVNFFSGVTDGRRSIAENIISTINFASGGIMTPFGKAPLRTYGGGGIANSPQVALYGEGSMPEAYVPLPDGHSIPVSFKGAANDDGAVVAEIRGLRAEVASLRAMMHDDNMEAIGVQERVRKDLRSAGIAGRR